MVFKLFVKVLYFQFTNSHRKTKRAEVKAIKSLGNKYVITVGADGYLRVYSSTMREELKSMRIVHIDENTETVKCKFSFSFNNN
jgi:purine nucleoside phosphorylase